MTAPRLLLVAVDRLDWPPMQREVDAGRLPYLAQLLHAGSHGRLHMPAPHGAASHWATLATGSHGRRARHLPRRGCAA